MGHEIADLLDGQISRAIGVRIARVLLLAGEDRGDAVAPRAETLRCRQRLLECSRPHLMWSAWDPLAFSWRLRRPFACDEVERLDRHLLDLARPRRSYAEVRAAVSRHVAVDPLQHLRRRVAGLVAGEHAQPHEADAIRRVDVDIALDARPTDARPTVDAPPLDTQEIGRAHV